MSDDKCPTCRKKNPYYDPMFYTLIDVIKTGDLDVYVKFITHGNHDTRKSLEFALGRKDRNQVFLKDIKEYPGAQNAILYEYRQHLPGALRLLYKVDNGLLFPVKKQNPTKHLKENNKKQQKHVIKC